MGLDEDLLKDGIVNRPLTTTLTTIKKPIKIKKERRENIMKKLTLALVATVNSVEAALETAVGNVANKLVNSKTPNVLVKDIPLENVKKYVNNVFAILVKNATTEGVALETVDNELSKETTEFLGSDVKVKEQAEFKGLVGIVKNAAYDELVASLENKEETPTVQEELDEEEQKLIDGIETDVEDVEGDDEKGFFTKVVELPGDALDWYGEQDTTTKIIVGAGAVAAVAGIAYLAYDAFFAEESQIIDLSSSDDNGQTNLDTDMFV